MSHLLGTLNGVITALFERLLRVVAGLAPLSALLIVSAVTGLVAVLVFRATSNQGKLSMLRARMSGNLLAVWLYRHDTAVVLTLQRTIAVDAMHRIALALPPCLVLALPVGLIMGQLNLRFAVRPLSLGRPAIVTVRWLEPPTWAELMPTDGLRVEASVRIHAERETVWRIRGDKPGLHRIIVRTERGSAEKSVAVGDGWGAVSQVRAARVRDMWLQPGEAPIPRTFGIASIEVTYPPLRFPVFGADTSWLFVFTLGAAASGLVAARALGTAL
jgi:hypothetical protein